MPFCRKCNLLLHTYSLAKGFNEKEGRTIRRGRRVASVGYLLPLCTDDLDSISHPTLLGIRRETDTHVTRTVATTNQSTTRREFNTDMSPQRLTKLVFQMFLFISKGVEIDVF